MEKILFSELRILASGLSLFNEFSEEGLRSALTDSKNLEALGFELKQEGVAKLASEYTKNPHVEPLFERVKRFDPKIEVSPMYPGFPYQVLDMDEEEYRLHQHLHYLTTYGVEYFTGSQVKEGWLPHNGAESKAQKGNVKTKQLIELKTIDFLSESEINEFIINNVIGKKERLTPQELVISKAVVEKRNRPLITEIPFKENIVSLYKDMMLSGDKNVRYSAQMDLAVVLKHPGDVLDLLEGVIVSNKYKHLRTSVKRNFIELLEKYGMKSLEENLASNRWSKAFLGKKGRARAINRNIALIDYLSYNKFSKNEEAKALVSKLKDGELFSWNQKLERAYKEEDLEEVRFLLNQRPGMYFRQLNRLLKNGVEANEIREDLAPKAENLKTQSIISALTNIPSENEELISLFYEILLDNLKGKEVKEIKGKKVFIDSGEFDLNKSRIEITDKFEEGGYIQSGLAIKIPEEVKVLRFFTYWNDEDRIDIDLHSSILLQNGEIDHVGWFGDYKTRGILMSGDITHSDAAEYIDIDLEEAMDSNVKSVQFNLNSYTRVKFNNIETLFTGMMAVDVVGQLLGKDNKDYSILHDPKNTFFRHDLNMPYNQVDYAILDLESKTLRILGKSHSEGNNGRNHKEIKDNLSLKTYIDFLLASQGATIVNSEEDADVVLGLPKKDDNDKYKSLIDCNYFL